MCMFIKLIIHLFHHSYLLPNIRMRIFHSCGYFTNTLCGSGNFGNACLRAIWLYGTGTKCLFIEWSCVLMAGVSRLTAVIDIRNCSQIGQDFGTNCWGRYILGQILWCMYLGLSLKRVDLQVLFRLRKKSGVACPP